MSAHNGFRNPQAGYVTTSLCSVVTTTALGFLNCVDPLDLVSSYYLTHLHVTDYLRPS